jgi:NAD(P)-dependent dehydrogenase (short-subunit alcohol dehydrogenase family)
MTWSGSAAHPNSRQGEFMLTSIAGRSVIATGASRGVGKGIARVSCRNGGRVFVVSRNLEGAEACAEELERLGSRWHDPGNEIAKRQRTAVIVGWAGLDRHRPSIEQSARSPQRPRFHDN